MRNLESYQAAASVLGLWNLSCEYISQLFLNEKVSRNLINKKYWI
jgi:hypothetical protein